MQLTTTQQDKIDKAKALYMSHISITDISNELTIPVKILRYYAFGEDGSSNSESCWSMLRSDQTYMSTTEFEIARPIILKMTQATLLQKVATGATNLEIEDVADLEKAVNVTEKLHKMERLEDNESTENIDLAGSGYTLREIMEQRDNQ